MNENPAVYLVKLLEHLSFVCSISVDFHGLVKTRDETLKFEFGSHNGGLKCLKEEKRKIFLYNSEQVERLSNFFSALTLDDFETRWLECHAEELGYGESGFRTERLLTTVCYISPLSDKIEEIFDVL